MSDIAAVGLDFQTAQAERNMRNVAREATAMGKAVEGAVTTATSKWDAFVQKANDGGQRSSATMKALEGVYQKLRSEAQLFERQQMTLGAGLPGAFAAGTAALGLFGIGFGTVLNAATSLYSYLTTSSSDTETILTEQARLVRLIKDAYKDANFESGKFLSETKEVLQLQNDLAIKALQDNLRTTGSRVLQTSVGYSPLSDGPMGNAFGQPDLNTHLLPNAQLRSAWEEFAGTVGQSGAAFEDLRKRIAAIGIEHPELESIAGDLLKISQDGGDAATKLKELFSTRALLNGTASPQDRDRLGLPNPMQGPPAPPRLTGGGSDPFESAIISSNKRIAAMRAEAEAVGQSAGAHAQLRMEAQLLEAAQQRGGTATEQQMKRIRELGLAANETAMQLERARINDQIKFGRQTALLSQEDVQIASQLRGLYPDVATALGSVEAQALRVNDAMRQFNDFGRSAFSGMLSEVNAEVRKGTNVWDAWEKAGSNALAKVSDKLIQMAADNLWNSAFGGNSSSSSSGGGIFSMLFRGAMAGLSAGGSSGVTAGAYTSDGALGVLGGAGGYVVPTYHHNGGIVGAGGFTRGSFPSVAWSNAEKFALGGIAGIGPDEVPIMAHRNEEVIRRDDPRHRYNGGAANSNATDTNVHVTVGVSVDESGNLQAFVKDVAQRQFRSGIEGYSRQELPNHVSRIRSRPRERG